MNQLKEKTSGISPAIVLMIISPLIAEVLPGATRFSSMFVFPIEVCVWGGGALLIRYAVKRWQLEWINMLFLALALSVAEECLIQQTSLAPMVIQLKGVVYGRVLGVNYVYFMWALVYESVFVVFLPIFLAELIFPDSREDLWISKAGLVAVISFLLIGSGLAWFTWTQIARIKVFHLSSYDPPFLAILIALFVFGGLIFYALGPFKSRMILKPAALKPPAPFILIFSGLLWAVLWYGFVLLGFGIAPSFPPLIAVVLGLLIVAIILYFVPRWVIHEGWQSTHVFAIIYGALLGSMFIGFIGFIQTLNMDLYFKIFVNILAIIPLTILGFKIRRRLI